MSDAWPAETACVRDVLWRTCDTGPPPLEVLSYNELRDLCIAHFGYSQLCQNVFDVCVDKDRQYVPSDAVPRVPLGTFLLYFSLDSCDQSAARLPKTRAGFLTHVQEERGNVVLYMKPRSWRVKYSGRVWLMHLTSMKQLARELKSNTLSRTETGDDAEEDEEDGAGHMASASAVDTGAIT